MLNQRLQTDWCGDDVSRLLMTAHSSKDESHGRVWTNEASTKVSIRNAKSTAFLDPFCIYMWFPMTAAGEVVQHVFQISHNFSLFEQHIHVLVTMERSESSPPGRCP